MLFGSDKSKMISAEAAVPGRPERSFHLSGQHFVLGTSMIAPFPSGFETILFGMGCFWGAERKFWQIADVFTTAVGYSGGFTANPSYEEVCSAKTGHNEVVLVVFDPEVVPVSTLLTTFWEQHDPTQGMRQGNDMGTQYRSGIYCTTDAQLAAALETGNAFEPRLVERGFKPITTEIVVASDFYYAEEYHQQYLAKNPGGYCGIGGTGVSCSVGVA